MGGGCGVNSRGFRRESHYLRTIHPIRFVDHRRHHSHSLPESRNPRNSLNLVPSNRSKSAPPARPTQTADPPLRCHLHLPPSHRAAPPIPVFPRRVRLRLLPACTQSFPLLQLKLRRHALCCVLPPAVSNSMSHGQSFSEGRSSRSRTRRQEKGIPRFLVQSPTGRLDYPKEEGGGGQ